MALLVTVYIIIPGLLNFFARRGLPSCFFESSM